MRGMAHRDERRGDRRKVGATPDVTSRTTWPSSGNPAEMAGLCPYPFPYQIWFDGDAVRARTAKRLYRRGHLARARLLRPGGISFASEVFHMFRFNNDAGDAGNGSLGSSDNSNGYRYGRGRLRGDDCGLTARPSLLGLAQTYRARPARPSLAEVPLADLSLVTACHP
jgi:hypothetical protein